MMIISIINSITCWYPYQFVCILHIQFDKTVNIVFIIDIFSFLTTVVVKVWLGYPANNSFEKLFFD